MKNRITFISLLTVTLLTQGCQKFRAGCTDELAVNYSTTAKMDDGSCFYQFSSDVTVTSWQYADPNYAVAINWPEITQEVISKGTISVFQVFSGNEIIELPYAFSYVDGYHSYWHYEASVGKVEIFRYDSDLIDPGDPGTVTFRIAVSY